MLRDANLYYVCTAVTDAPTGHITLGANMANGIEQKGIDSLQQCIKKCAAAGLGIPATVSVVTHVGDSRGVGKSCVCDEVCLSVHAQQLYHGNRLEPATPTSDHRSNLPEEFHARSQDFQRVRPGVDTGFLVRGDDGGVEGPDRGAVGAKCRSAQGVE